MQPRLLLRTKRDDAIFSALEQRVRAKHEDKQQTRQLLSPVPMDGNDVVDAVMSHDGLLTEYRHARLMPFNVACISEALWEWNLADFYADESAQVWRSMQKEPE